MRELFASDTFNFQDFLASQSGVPLEELIKTLENISKIVQNELYELINEDLVHFQKVLKDVCEIDIEAVKQFRSEFEQEKSLKEKAFLNFKEYFDEINRKFQRLKYIQKKKETMIKLKKARQYISVFKERQIKSEHSLYELEINVKNYIWLLNFCTELSGELIESESTSDIHRELSRYSESLQEILEIQLKRNLVYDKLNESHLVLLIDLCKEMNKMNLFEASFKMAIVYPSIERIYQETGGNFEAFLEKSFTFINDLKKKLNVLPPVKSDFFIKSVLAPIISWIIERYSQVFIPDPVKEFKNNFEKGLEFIYKIENEFFEFEDEIVLFRSQAAWINFMKKWALHQYFQIVSKQAYNTIETCLRNRSGIANASKMPVEVFEPTLVVIESLKQIWKDDVILKPLIPKFLKLTIQVFRRFIHFCTEDSSEFVDPKMFLIFSLQKQFNLKHFIEEKGLEEQLKKYLDPLIEGEKNITSSIMDQLKLESEESLKKSRDNMIPGIEKLYDQLLLKREDVKNLRLDTFKLIQEAGIHVTDIHSVLQQILLKFNRTIFKLIDEKRLNPKEYPEILKEMKEIEGEAKELGYENLGDEEFWLEIKAVL